MLTSDEMNKVVNYYPVLSGLPPELKLAFENSSSRFHAKLDAHLFDFSALVQSYMMLTSGTIRVTRQGRCREIVLYRVQPGENCILTVCNILSETLYQTISTAETEICGVAIPATLFKHMIEQSPTFYMYIFRSFSGRLSGLLGLIDEITFMQLDERLAGLLLSKGSVVKTTHSQLADELGSVREVISRILKDFEFKGLVKLDRNLVQTVDQEALKKIARLW
jgi:CRP/FNR family transcriptional regulator, anaerobic regulatory protein